MSALLFHLAQDKKAYQTLASEIRRTFSKADDIQSGPLLQTCEYLDACVMETLRICPSTPGAPWREVQKDGMVIDGHFISEGCDVGV